MITWIKRWHKIGYRKLWYTHYGEGEYHKGCYREYRFLLEVSGGWKNAFESERSLRLEAEGLLQEAGIEPPVDKRFREIMERIAKK